MKTKILRSYALTFLRSYILTFLLSYVLTVSTAQPLNYNPYDCAQEELFINSPSFRARHESRDCETARELINRFVHAETKGKSEEKWNLIKSVSFCPCAESYHFLETVIKNSNSETDRCNALINLAWMQNPDMLPAILEYSKKPTLSVREKAAVATAFTIYGIRDSLPRLVAQAITILDEIGYDCPEDALEHAILSYWMLGGNAALNFFNAQLEKKEYKLHAALFLAQLGEYKQTFPIFKAALSSDDEYEVHTAIMGLAAIDTEEASQLISNLPPEKNRCALKEMRFNFDFNNFNERR